MITDRIPIRDVVVAREVLSRMVESRSPVEGGCPIRQQLDFWRWLSGKFPQVRKNNWQLGFTSATEPFLAILEPLKDPPEGSVQIDSDPAIREAFWLRYNAHEEDRNPLTFYELWTWVESQFPQMRGKNCQFWFGPSGIWVSPLPDDQERRTTRAEIHELERSWALSNVASANAEDADADDAEEDPHPFAAEEEPLSTEDVKRNREQTRKTLCDVLRMLDFFLTGGTRPLTAYEVFGGEPNLIALSDHVSRLMVNVRMDGPSRVGEVMAMCGTPAAEERLRHPVTLLLARMAGDLAVSLWQDCPPSSGLRILPPRPA